MRPIDAEKLEKDFTDWYNRAYPRDKELIEIAILSVRDAPTIEAEPVTWYTADENQPDSAGDDVLIVDHDDEYHIAYYCSKGNWIDTNTGNPIEVVKWRYLREDNNE